MRVLSNTQPNIKESLGFIHFMNICANARIWSFIPLSLSEELKKLVVMESFSDVVNLLSMPAFLADHGSNVASSSDTAGLASRDAFL